MQDLYERYREANELFEQRRFIDAAKLLEEIIDATNGDQTYGVGEAPLLLARAYFGSAQLGRAEQATRRLIEANPTDGYALLLLARTLERAGRGTEAEPYRRQAAALGATD